jgi:hypothetical protein
MTQPFNKNAIKYFSLHYLILNHIFSPNLVMSNSFFNSLNLWGKYTRFECPGFGPS